MTNQRDNEADVRLKFINPAITSKWDVNTQVRTEYFFTDGRVSKKGKTPTRGGRKFADYLLQYKKNIPLAIVEAKHIGHNVGDGMQQAIEYAEILDVPYVYTSNGEAFQEYDRKRGKERIISISDFPTPDELWERYRKDYLIDSHKEKVITEPYYTQVGGKEPRYYQVIAINRTVEAVAEGRKRILLVMATGTGKTFTAFQIIHRLRKAGEKKRILYLADRNFLIDQTMQRDFKPFERFMTKVTDRKLDSSYEVYMSLYQQLAGDEGEEPFRKFASSFFDLIVVDECHRGSAKEESQWRRILEYFKDATQIGMTATPKETREISSIDYFGEPLFTYSLRQGIEDGFLAPYNVIRVVIDRDAEGYRPEAGKTDIYGKLVEDKEYEQSDFDRHIVIDERTKLVAKKITEYMIENDRFAKTIVFCVDIEHATRMRTALINENSDLVSQNSKYIMKITGDDPEGKAQLDNFIAEDSDYPVIVTTSELLTTGVDCKTCKLIVIDKEIDSPIVLKQIVGRGTRLVPDYNKWFFTILDFRGATRQFSHDDFWEIPEQEEDFGKETPQRPRQRGEEDADEGGLGKKVYVDGVPVEIISERVMFYSNGKLITENIIDYSKKNILGEYPTLDEFLQAWNADYRKQVIINELQEHGVFLEQLRSAAGNTDIDDFDLICHMAFDKKPLTRAERIESVRGMSYLDGYKGLAREVLSALMERYANGGVGELEDMMVLEIDPIRSIGTPQKIIREFGGRDRYLIALKELQDAIYSEVGN